MNADTGNKTSVLIIDDSASLRQYVEDILNGAGYQVGSAPDGEKGLELIKGTQPDVVLLDIEMPVMNGREVLAALSPSGRLFSVVVLTSLSAMQDCLSIFGIGADDYIAKPFNDDELLARVRSAARTAQLKKELAASRDEALELLHKYESSERKLAEERELTAISKLISGIADKISDPVGVVRSNIGNLLKYSDTLLLLGERITALHARKFRTGDDLKQALHEELEWMQKSGIDRIKRYFGPLAKETARGIDRISAIVNKLLQIDIVNRPAEKKPVNVGNLMNALAEKARARNPEITVSLEAGGESFMVECDESRISAALENVIENACEAVGVHGWVLIRISNDKDTAIIDISDSGPGIPKGKLDAVFDPFFSDKQQPGKTGLGLTISRYFINAHKGSISIRSDAGKGTRVSVSLPITGPDSGGRHIRTE